MLKCWIFNASKRLKRSMKYTSLTLWQSLDFFFSIIQFCFSLLLKSIPITVRKVLIIPNTPCSLTSRMKGKDLACYNSVSNLLWSLFVLGQGKNTKDKKKTLCTSVSLKGSLRKAGTVVTISTQWGFLFSV